MAQWVMVIVMVIVPNPDDRTSGHRIHMMEGKTDF